MILINLLPHREMARQQARQAFNAALVAAVLVGALAAGGVYMWLQGQKDRQEDRNAYLSSEIVKLDKQIKDVAALEEEIAALKARQQAVEDLQSDRNMPVHLLNEAVRQLSDGLYLKEIRQENQFVLVRGVSQSNERVSEFLRNLSYSSDWIAKPELVEIVASSTQLSSGEKRRVYDFTIRVQLLRASEVQKAAEERGQTAAAAARAPA